MAKAIGGTILGAFLGLIVGGAVAILTPFDTRSFLFARNAFCVLLGVGFGAVSGAIVGSAGAIVDAIDRRK